jgi:DNA-binding response OmpR family regulator
LGCRTWTAEVLRQLRKTSGAPVIIVSGNNSKESVVRAFAVEADDYITKPFAPMEHMARVGGVT